jgi:hypothetical protein
VGNGRLTIDEAGVMVGKNGRLAVPPLITAVRVIPTALLHNDTTTTACARCLKGHYENELPI